MGIQCFFIKETGKTVLSLRRYCNGITECTTNNGIGHTAQVGIEEKGDVDTDGYVRDIERGELFEKYKDNFPVKCDCGYEFTDADPKQIYSKREYIDAQGNTMTLRSAAVGAMWYADYYMHEGTNFCKGPDGHCLVVRTPGGDWIVDSRASNCTLPDDDVHKCWVRSGEPPNITVGKAGFTCSAGAGSIAIGTQGTPNYYHGFLQNGELT